MELVNCEEVEGRRKKIKKRGQWNSNIEFFLVVAGNIVGLGNVWRFPYLCYRNGGGAFLVPYVVVVVTCGIPLFLLESAMGQYTQQASITCWEKLCPIAQGIGYTGIIMRVYNCMSYVIILAWALLYLCFSFYAKLPWASCGHTWNTETCEDFNALNKYNQTINTNSTSPATEFWERRVLAISGGIEELGSVRWEILLCAIAMWVICYFCIWKGVKSTGKVVYFTATFPYVMLLVLLIRGLTLPGALQGIVYYLKPDLTPLLDPQVWMEAVTQVIFSFGVGGGLLASLCSYNPYNNNCYRNCFWLCLLNAATSLVAGFAVFSVLGFMAHEYNVGIAEVAESGPGLAFIAYPQAVAMMPLPQLWAICFFIMIILLGLDSQFVMMEGVIMPVIDLAPTVLRRPGRRELLLLVFSLFCFSISILMITEGGMYVLQVFDYYGMNASSKLFLSSLQCLTMGWIFGAERMCDAIEDMTGVRPSRFFSLCWRYLTPLVCTASFVGSLANYKPLTFNRTYTYPVWVNVLGWIMMLSSSLAVPVLAVYLLCTGKGSLKQRCIHLCQCADDLPLTRKQREELSKLNPDAM
ncbi:sodium- and chloride-dependent GABA transporter 2-like isoform X1 [Denticeps clupeoides]|uniref:Transporter n=1 Tax=Denticeps clupeoides TaxID=299321 RepID=A0AAY4BMP0_9TELE|nr:sodium- and chloride-dependent GABA transporter 2-like isoform X2 [Denticeps clupeoides]XP_028822733.1 sodium- and chloride-dependent GABA transporter 2-like isoform X1 [Denticeps clupeoides]XP_028856387.1 sodium- and chloride-dependent GABA transporter 2-like isoform X1 [Denticeps clupeoides]